MKKSTMIIILCIFTIMGCKVGNMWAENSSKLSQEEVDEFMRKAAQFYAEKQLVVFVDVYCRIGIQSFNDGGRLNCCRRSSPGGFRLRSNDANRFGYGFGRDKQCQGY